MRRLLLTWLLAAAPAIGHAQTGRTTVRGEVVDESTGRPLPCRIAIQSQGGSWFFPRSATPEGSAVEYRKVSLVSPSIVEMHTTLSAHPFVIDLPPGTYRIDVERGKEYVPRTRTVEVRDEPLRLRIPLTRWIDAAARGWYSGETHVHRGIDELPNLMLAEDLNVAFPIQDWTRAAGVSPIASRPADFREPPQSTIRVDSTHVIDTRNTEYELFTVGSRRHTLGAFFVIRHQKPLGLAAPPVGPAARLAHEEGALLELDKHNWPWSLAIIPIMKIDLFELANNHLWRTTFGFREFGEPAPAFMKVERDERGMTERGWIDFGFRAYYTLLDCGFRLRPTAGTASGVHPVPLGFGRVYVHLPEGFDGDAWFRGLGAGRSFVTTGPMLFVTLDQKDPGQRFDQARTYVLKGQAIAPHPLQSIEVIQNGQVEHVLPASNRPTKEGAFESSFELGLPIASTSWVAVRCFEKRPDGRPRFAHSAPFFIDVPGRPLLPLQAEKDWLVERVEAEIRRSESVLPAPAIAEYREALKQYRAIEAQPSGPARSP